MHASDISPARGAQACGQRKPKVYVGGSDFLEVRVTDMQPGSREDNADRFEVEIATPGGQPLEVLGREIEKVQFAIVGNFELDALFEAVADIARQMKRREAR